MRKPLKSVVAFLLYTLSVLVTLSILNGAFIFSNSAAFFFTWLFLTIIYGAAFLLLGNLAVSASLVSLVLFVICGLNFYRMLLSSLPFKPQDFLMANRAGDLLSFVTVRVEWEMVLTLVLLAAEIVAFVFACGKFHLEIRTRFLSLCTFFAAFLGVFGTSLYASAFEDWRIMTVNGRYREYGVVLGFYMSLDFWDANYKSHISVNSAKTQDGSPKYDTNFITDREYSEELMNDIWQFLDSTYGEKHTSLKKPQKPNVVVIMSEAFTDTGQWPSVEFSSDPVPNLHILQQMTKNVKTGSVLTPAFGGSTCDPEFEFLTGNSFGFVQSDDTPFVSVDKYFDTDVPYALPMVFKQNGYETYAIHTHFVGEEQGIYKRSIIYPKVGFDALLGREEMSNAKMKGWLGLDIISDEYFTDLIIDKLEKNRLSQTPLFLYGISMQNHAYYTLGRYLQEDLQIIAKHENFTPKMEIAAQMYSQGVFDADKQLMRLLDYLSDTEEPTVVFFFGDHQPLLGTQNNDVFQAMGLLKNGDPYKWTLEDFYKMHKTPYVMWSNFAMDTTELEDMSTFFLGANLLEAVGLDKNYYYSLILDLYSEINGIFSGDRPIFVNKENEVSFSANIQNVGLLEIYSWIEYDMLYGEKYLFEKFSNWGP